MTSELRLLKYVKKMPSKERCIYLLMNAYREALIRTDTMDSHIREDAAKLISEIYEEEINELLETPSIYIKHDPPENKQIDKKDSSENKQDRSIIKVIDKQFDEKLGRWDLSSTSSTSSEDEDNLNSNCIPHTVESMIKERSDSSEDVDSSTLYPLVVNSAESMTPRWKCGIIDPRSL